MRDLCARYLLVTPLVAGPGVNMGVAVKIDRPAEAGADLVMNCSAAYHRYGGPAIAIGFGTATTFSCVNADGDYVGTAIAPGLALSLETLAGRAAQLYSIELKAPERAIGTNTTASMQSGIMSGLHWSGRGEQY